MSRQIITLLFAGALFLCGADTPSGVPAGSTEVSPGTYRFVDKDKKVWIYRRTPFGFQKSAEDRKDAASERDRKSPDAASATPAPASQPDPNRTTTPFGESKPSPASAPQTKVTEMGDSVRFERPSPFGVYRWTKKKTELTEDEKKLWDAQRSAPAQANGK